MNVASLLNWARLRRIRELIIAFILKKERKQIWEG
jgi:hypothetical protein